MQPRSSWGGETPRLLIDVAAVAHEHARPYLPGPLATETDQVLGQLRLGQVSAEGHASRSGELEQNDLDRVPTPTSGGAAQPPADQASGKLWSPDADSVSLSDRDSLAVMPMRSGLFLPIFDELADPATVARLSSEAEEAGWHGVFVWDHVRWRPPVLAVADPWITLAAVATATERVRLGPMVTPLARRRPVKVARETATLDRLAGGRLTLGVGLGSDQFGNEFSITGEELDERRRARMVDESLDILTAAWSGEQVQHRGEHYTIDGMRFLPRPLQQPGVPVWIAGLYGKPRPLRRAARYQGFIPVNLEHPDQLAQIAADLTVLRQAAGTADTQPYDIAAALPPGSDPVPYAAVGATWWLVEFPAQATTADLVRAVIRDGPAAHG